MAYDYEKRLFCVLRDHPFTKKIIVTSSFSEGHQLLERISIRYGPALNTEVSTVESLAVHHAGFELFRHGYRYLTEGETFWILHGIMKQLSGRNGAYIRPEMLTPGIVTQVHRAVCELRKALIPAKDLQPAMFVTPEKGRYIRELLMRYEQWLAGDKAADFAGLLPFLSALNEEVLFIMPDHLRLDPASEKMLKKMAAGRLVKLDTTQSPDTIQSPDMIQSPDTPQFRETGNGKPEPGAEFFHAAGSDAEVRESFRRILATGLPFDRVEIIASDYDLYAAALYTAAAQFGIPCTFSGGLPLEWMPMGRAALNLIAWIEESYPAERLAGMLRERQIAFRDDQEKFTAADWIREMEQSGIGWGRDRYLSADSGRVAEERKAVAGSLSTIFRDWFQGLPEGGEWTIRDLLNWLVRILDCYGVAHGEQDAFILQSLKELSGMLEHLPDAPMAPDLALQYIRNMLRGIRCCTTPMPQPGAVHVTSLSDGGMSGRDVTFILGMDERSWSTSVRQHPLLLDQERERIGGGLPLSAERAEQKRRELTFRLRSLKGKLVLGFSSYLPADKQTQNPAFEMLAYFRKETGNPEADFSMLREHLGVPAGRIDWGKNRETAPLDAFDVWRNVLFGADGTRKDGREAVERVYPHLAAGRTAVEMRASVILSSYDGYIGEQGRPTSAEVQGIEEVREAKEAPGPAEARGEADGGGTAESRGTDGTRRHVPVISASRLESYAQCPMRYYFLYVLRMRPKERAVFDRSRWLRADERGNLLHRIFFLYYKQLMDGSSPVKHDKSLLGSITDQVIGQYAGRIPAPSRHVFDKECRDIHADVDVFYRMETESASLPRYLELELSVEGRPLEIVLEDGVSIRMAGFVDRIDETAAHQYRIIDYKTGSSGDYRQSGMFAGGTRLQHALYSVAAEQWLRQTGADPHAVVREAVYYFPTRRGRGQKIVRLQHNRKPLADAVRHLLQAMDRGFYIPTKDPKICAWCEYRPVCGNHAEHMKEKRQAPDIASRLQPLLEVERLD